MNWVEFHTNSTCPHCGEENYESFEFDMLSSDTSGVTSAPREIQCGNWTSCEKKYWSKAYLSFEVEEEQTSKTKFKDKK